MASEEQDSTPPPLMSPANRPLAMDQPECQGCVQLQNQMLRFKEQVVVIRGNLGNRMAGLEKQLQEASERADRVERDGRERADKDARLIAKLRKEVDALRAAKGQETKSNEELRKQMTHFFNVSKEEKEKQIAQLRAKLAKYESLTAAADHASARRSFGVQVDVEQEPPAAVAPPRIPERPASTWRNSLSQTTGKLATGGNSPRVPPPPQLSDDYEMVNDEDIFVDARQSLSFTSGEDATFDTTSSSPAAGKVVSRTGAKLEHSSRSLPCTESPPTGLTAAAELHAIPERPQHKYPKWEEAVYSSIKQHGFHASPNAAAALANGLGSCSGSLLLDKSDDLDTAAAAATAQQTGACSYVYVGGAVHALPDHPTEVEARLAQYAVAAGVEDTGSSPPPSAPGLAEDWLSSQADYCIPPDALPDHVQDRDYVKEADLELILSKSSTVSSMLDSHNMPTQLEVYSGNLQLLIEEVSSLHESPATLTRTSLSIPGLTRPLFTFPLDNILRVSSRHDRLFRLVFHDGYSVLVCAHSTQQRDTWVAEITRLLPSRPLNGQSGINGGGDGAVVRSAALWRLVDGRREEVWAVLAPDAAALHIFASQRDKRPVQSFRLRGAQLFHHGGGGDGSANELSDESEDCCGSRPMSDASDSANHILVLSSPGHDPLFLSFPSMEELSEWKYQCELCSGAGIPSSGGTLFETAISQLMRSPTSADHLWTNAPFAYDHSKRSDSFEPLTTLRTSMEREHAERVWKLLLRCLKLRHDARSNPQSAAQTDSYFVTQAQSAFDLILRDVTLQNEACCQLVRLCNTKDLPTFSVTAFQLLCLFVTLAQPNTAYLWLLRQFLHRTATTNTVEAEERKYALYCLQLLGRSKSQPRKLPPSSIEVISITKHNPYDVAHPMAVPVILPDGSTRYAGCDGMMTVGTFLASLLLSLDMREPRISGYALFLLSPLSTRTEVRLGEQLIVADVVAQYETLCKRRELDSTTVKLILKNRFSWARLQQGETERERLLAVHTYANAVCAGLVPVSADLAYLLTALMCHIELGASQMKSSVSKQTVGIKIMEMIRQYYPIQYLNNMNSDQVNFLCLTIQTFWTDLCTSRASQADCIRAYLTAVRSWRLRDCRLFPFSWLAPRRGAEKEQVVLAVGEPGLSLLSLAFQPIVSHPLDSLVSFGAAGGGKKGKLQLAFSHHLPAAAAGEDTKRYELLGPHAQVGQVVALIADYISELHWLARHVPEYSKAAAAGAANGSSPAGGGGKHDSLMVLRC